MVTAFYSLTTGIIQSTLNGKITDPNQIASIRASGQGMIDVPLGTDGSNAIVDLSTTTIISLAPPTPIPDLLSQIAAALISANVIPANSLHATSVAQINATLTTAKMTPIS